MTHVLVMAKAPLPGRVKTRLCPPLSFEQAAAVAAAALADTLDAVAACHADRRIVALDGAPGPWLPAGFEVIPQRGGGLDERLANAWGEAGGAGIQIGMDTPQVTASELDGLLSRLANAARRRRAVLARAEDGGWWAIGLPGGVDARAIFTGVPMSTPWTASAQERRLRRLGYEVEAGPVHRDVDTAADLAAVAAAAPGIRTARLAGEFLAARSVA
jgi:glycosyltransferase A (GT-A) superfamily protein (DUF2064 family)